MAEESVSFGYWVRRRRKTLDLTQAELAQRVSCTESLIRKIESDVRRPSRQMAELLADVLKVPAGERALFLQVARAERSVERLSAAATPAYTPPPPTTGEAAFAAPASNLPSPSTAFVGRTQDVETIVANLRDPDCRLVTLIGPGGIGKTRLAIRCAEIFAGAAREGKSDGPGPIRAEAPVVLFVPLAAVDNAAGIVYAIAGAAGFHFYENAPPRQQLLEYLRNKQLLLLLDNFEHLLAGADLVADILATAPGVKILATSREALGLIEAWIYPVGGLTLPRNGGSLALESCDAVQLFLQSARRARVGFSLSATREHVLRICQMVDGMPLAIELAAAWLTSLPIEQVATEIERNLDILTARHQNLPSRHRSIRAVFEQSWQMLPQHGRDVLKQLSVCRGGFRLDAAVRMAGASAGELATLIDKCLLRIGDNGRYEMHELLRQFAHERLVAQQQESEVRARHSAYYLAFLHARRAELVGPEQRATLDAVAEEFENLRTAWQWAVEARDDAALDRALDPLYDFCQIRSRYQDGYDLVSYALQRLGEPADGATAVFPARLCLRRGAFQFFLGNYDAARQDLEWTGSIQDALPTGERVFALTLLGQIAGWQSRRDEAVVHLQAGLALCRQANDRSGAADVLHKLAQVHASFGRYEEARQLAEECLALCRQLGRPDWIGYAQDVLGWVTVCLGDYMASEQHYRAALAIFEASGDPLGMALALGGLGSVAWALGGENLDEAAELMTSSLVICRSIGHSHHASSRLWYLAQIAVEQGDYPTGRRFAEEGYATAEALGGRIFMAYNLCSLGAACCGLGDQQTGCRHLQAALRMAAGAEHLPPVILALLSLAPIWQSSTSPADTSPAQQRRQALTLLAWVVQHPASWVPLRTRAERLMAELAVGLAPAELAGARTAASGLTLHDVVALVDQESPCAGGIG